MLFLLKLWYMMQRMVPNTYLLRKDGFLHLFYIMMMSALWHMWWIGHLLWAHT